MKNNALRFVSVLLCMVFVLVPLASCNGGAAVDTGADTSGNDSSNDPKTYTVTVKTSGGMALSGVNVFVYEDDTLSELLTFATTNEEGKATFDAVPSDKYVFTLTNVTGGYQIADFYRLSGDTTEVVLGSSVVSGDISNVKYKLGDIMYDFEVTATDGKTYKASELLSQYKALVLNFWYIECVPCVNEMPYLQDAYAQYIDDIALIGLNGQNKDDSAIAQFAETNSISFPLAQSPADLTKAMGITAYPTTVIVDRNGVICLIEKGTITESGIFEAAFNFFTADDYTQTLVEDINTLVPEEDDTPDGSAEKPYVVGGVLEFDAEVEAGKSVFYNVFNVSGMIMTVNDANVSIKYDGKTYTPENGKIEIKVQAPDTYTPVALEIINTGSANKTFKVKFSFIKGTLGDPYALELGDFITDLEEGNESGIYYTYTATKAGKLVLKLINVSGGADADCVLYNLNTYAQRALKLDGSENVVSIKVNVGDVVQVIVCTVPDSTFKYPAASVKMNASIDESTDDDEDDKPIIVEADYKVTVKDEWGAALSNVKLVLSDGKSTLTLWTNASGEVSGKLILGDVSVVLTLPDGYTAEKTTYTLGNGTTELSIVLKKKTAEYSVIVKGEDGKAVEGVTLTFTDGKNTVTKTTNSEGKASATLIMGSGKVTVTVPDGFVLDDPNYDFDGQSEIMITLYNDVPPVIYKDYTVSVTDMFGNAVTGYTVVIKDALGEIVAVKAVGADGSVTENLVEGRYTVEITRTSGAKFWHNAADAVLSKTITSTKIKVADYNTSAIMEDYIYDEYDVYELSSGALYYPLVNGERNYFVFTPTEAGVYHFTTSSTLATIGYYGGTFFILSSNAANDYDPNTNSFSMEVKDQHLGQTYVIGVDANGSTEGCVVIVYTAGELSPDTIYDTYQPTADLKQYNVTDVYGANPNFKPMDLTADEITIVYNENDGYYHYGTKNGPVVLVYLGKNAPYNLPFKTIVGKDENSIAGGSSVCFYYTNDDGLLVREDYTDCIIQYIDVMDTTYEMYPLTMDLATIIQNYGEHQGYWDPSSPSYKFADEPGINHDIAWLLLCCYVEQ